MAEKILDLIPVIFMLIFDLFIIALPFLFLFAVYHVIKKLMTHNANLKRQNQQDKNNDRWNPESR